MKKIINVRIFIILLSALLVFVGCAEEEQFVISSSATYVYKFGEDAIDMTFLSGIYPYKDWDNPDLTYREPVIPNREVAIAIATQIFIGMFEGELPENYVPQMVFYDEIDEIWIVSFWKDNSNDNTITVGGEYSIAMQKSDGKVLRIWLGE